jgi:ABC-type polysaccharide transport system permease subunit
VLGFIYILIWGVVIANKYFKERNLELDLKSEWLSASEFTIMIKNMPKGFINHS